jgi:hypothetical protein
MDEKRSTQEPNFLQCYLSTPVPTWTALAENKVLRGERPPMFGCWNYVMYLVLKNQLLAQIQQILL